MTKWFSGAVVRATSDRTPPSESEWFKNADGARPGGRERSNLGEFGVRQDMDTSRRHVRQAGAAKYRTVGQHCQDAGRRYERELGASKDRPDGSQAPAQGCAGGSGASEHSMSTCSSTQSFALNTFGIARRARARSGMFGPDSEAGAPSVLLPPAQSPVRFGVRRELDLPVPAGGDIEYLPDGGDIECLVADGDTGYLADDSRSLEVPAGSFLDLTDDNASFESGVFDDADESAFARAAAKPTEPAAVPAGPEPPMYDIFDAEGFSTRCLAVLDVSDTSQLCVGGDTLDDLLKGILSNRPLVGDAVSFTPLAPAGAALTAQVIIDWFVQVLGRQGERLRKVDPDETLEGLHWLIELVLELRARVPDRIVVDMLAQRVARLEEGEGGDVAVDAGCAAPVFVSVFHQAEESCPAADKDVPAGGTAAAAPAAPALAGYTGKDRNAADAAAATEDGDELTALRAALQDATLARDQNPAGAAGARDARTRRRSSLGLLCERYMKRLRRD